MYLVGLTGGIGSGKSTVAARFAELGAYVIDADLIAREVVEPGSDGLAAIVARFGREVLQDDGSLDRAALAAVVFGDPEARRDLNAITHPRIGQRIGELIAQHQAASAEAGDDRIVVVDHPLLIETGQASAFPAVVVVLAPKELRVERLVARGMDASDARARITAQAHDDQRREVATHVVTNEGSLEDLHRQADAVLRDLEAAASRASASA